MGVCLCICVFVFCVCVLLCLIGCGKNFVISRNRAPPCQTSSPANHQITVVFVSRHHFCHFSLIIILLLLAQFVIYGRDSQFASGSFHHNSLMVASSDWCSALSPVSSKLPSEGEGVVKFGKKIFAFGRASWAHYANNFYSNLLLKLCTAFIFPLINPFLTIFADY